MILSEMITILISNHWLRPHRWLLPLLALSTFVVAACADGDAGSSPDLKIVTTTSIWGDVVSQIVGANAVVEVLIPVGGDPHDYRPTPRQVAALGRPIWWWPTARSRGGLIDVLAAARPTGPTCTGGARSGSDRVLRRGHADADEADDGESSIPTSGSTRSGWVEPPS
jgi:hypothetical protein